MRRASTKLQKRRPAARQSAREPPLDAEHVMSPEEKLDESLEETFPCSDAPAWTVGSRIGSPR
jgi:hypothetical protein